MTSRSTRSLANSYPLCAGRSDARAARLASTLVLALLRIYRFTLSPFLGVGCRFAPSCSRYAEQAVRTYGVLRGGRMAIRRLARCHPWNAGGYDPVPERLEG